MIAQREFSDGEIVPGTRYRVISLIGMGGMGSVYEVEHRELGKRFVLKALLKSLANREDLELRLRNEWRALGRLEHPNIVSVTDAGVTSTSIPYYVMERLQGETLASRLRRQRRLEVAEALGIASDVLEGLSAAHQIGIVHRDVKPPNIFLIAARQAKLLDFGIAKVLDPKASQITGRGLTLGTPRYMAPEQATGAPIDGRTDLYAVGLVLFEMLAGAGPFESARDANELFLAHVAHEAPLVSSKNRRVPPELDRWVAQLLAKRPDERPSDAGAVAKALRRLAERGREAPAAAPTADDRTVPGGPFDAIERAETVASEASPRAGVDPRSRRVASEAVTRTQAGAPGDDTRTGAPPSLPASGTAATLPDSGAPSGPVPSTGSQTLRLDAFDDAPPTRTAVPSVQPETPPPVEKGDAAAVLSPRRLRSTAVVGALAVVTAAAIAGAFFLRSGNPSHPVSSSSSSVAETAPQSILPAAASSPAPAAAEPARISDETAATASPAPTSLGAAPPLASPAIPPVRPLNIAAPVPATTAPAATAPANKWPPAGAATARPRAPARSPAPAPSATAVRGVPRVSSGLESEPKKAGSHPVETLPGSGL